MKSRTYITMAQHLTPNGSPKQNLELLNDEVVAVVRYSLFNIPQPLCWGFVPFPGVPCFGSKLGGFCPGGCLQMVWFVGFAVIGGDKRV